MATAIVRTIEVWDTAVGGRSRAPAEGSHAWFDEHVAAPQLNLPPEFARCGTSVVFLTCGSVMQIARSVAALYAVSEDWALTFGKLPLMRSVLEGVGQLAWVIGGDEPLRWPDVSSEAEAVEAARERAARSAILWAECLRQGKRDLKGQGELEASELFKVRLTEWKALGRATFPNLVIDKERYDRWIIDDVELPGFGDMANRGTKLATWTEETEPEEHAPESPDEPEVEVRDPEGAMYPWLSAASQHRLYPFMLSLEEADLNGKRALRTTPDLGDVAAAGLVVGWALSRMVNLALAHVGWSFDGLDQVGRTLVDVHALIHQDEVS